MFITKNNNDLKINTLVIGDVMLFLKIIIFDSNYYVKLVFWSLYLSWNFSLVLKFFVVSIWSSFLKNDSIWSSLLTLTKWC